MELKTNTKLPTTILLRQKGDTSLINAEISIHFNCRMKLLQTK